MLYELSVLAVLIFCRPAFRVCCLYCPSCKVISELCSVSGFIGAAGQIALGVYVFYYIALLIIDLPVYYVVIWINYFYYSIEPVIAVAYGITLGICLTGLVPHQIIPVLVGVTPGICHGFQPVHTVIGKSDFVALFIYLHSLVSGFIIGVLYRNVTAVIFSFNSLKPVKDIIAVGYCVFSSAFRVRTGAAVCLWTDCFCPVAQQVIFKACYNTDPVMVFAVPQAGHIVNSLGQNTLFIYKPYGSGHSVFIVVFISYHIIDAIFSQAFCPGKIAVSVIVVFDIAAAAVYHFPEQSVGIVCVVGYPL